MEVQKKTLLFPNFYQNFIEDRPQAWLNLQNFLVIPAVFGPYPLALFESDHFIYGITYNSIKSNILNFTPQEWRALEFFMNNTLEKKECSPNLAFQIMRKIFCTITQYPMRSCIY